MNIYNFILSGRINFIKISIICLITIINSQASLAQTYSYKFNYLTVDEGLSHTDANDIAQDKYGYIWIATYFGLDRFDGYNVKKYYNKNKPLLNAYKNRVRFVYPDHLGYIWIGAEDGLQLFDPKYETYTDLVDKHSNVSPYFSKIIRKGNRLFGLTDSKLKLYSINDKTISELPISVPGNVRFSDICLDKNGLIYLSSDKGIWNVNENLSLSKIKFANSSSKDFLLIYFNKDNNLLTATEDTLYRAESKNIARNIFLVKNKFNYPDLRRIKNMVQNGNSDYWINTGPALIRVDKDFNFVQLVNSKSGQSSLNSNSISKVIIDRSGCLWLATFGGGVNYCDLNEKLFRTMKHDPENPNSLSGNHVRAILDDCKNLWIGTTANGLSIYNFKTRKFHFLNANSSFPKLKSNTVTSLTKDNEGNTWIGNSQGIEILKSDGKNLYVPKGAEKFPTYIIETIVKDYFGNIWFGNHINKFGVIYKDQAGIYQVKYYGEGYFIYPDSTKPELFISSTNGLKRVIIDKMGNIKELFEYRASARKNSLSSDYTYPVVKDSDSSYWIGTMGGGLNNIKFQNNKKSYSIKIYNGKYGVFNDVESIEVDDEGKIWMGGNGLQVLDPSTGKTKRYDKNDGLQGNSFKVGASYKGSDGRLYFGGISGLNYFYPKEIKSNPIEARPVLTDIRINNHTPDFNSDNENYIANAIGYSEDLSISNHQNNFVIFFSSMHFANPLKCRYRYKLIGFDKDWKYTNGENPSASYSNLNFNRYRFVVQATNNDGIWSRFQAETSIVLTPPWWKSDFAKILYFVILLSGLISIYIFQARWYRLKREIALREANETKREEMHKQRQKHSEQQLMFFTNISHEFRTPLTLILGPLENLIKQNSNPSIDNSYQIMVRNTKRLLNLVSELMNFRKASEKAMKLQVEPLAINDFCKGLTEEFSNLAKPRNIDFVFKDHTDHDPSLSVGLFDVQILEKILFNLLNNAFKYTSDGGSISLEVLPSLDLDNISFENGFNLLNAYRAKKYTYFKVSDSGIGISKDSIEMIFDRYYRVSTNHLGSGIGLALVKSLVELHKGDIYVFSERYKGTEIIIGFPSDEESYSALEKATKESLIRGKLEPLERSILAPLNLSVLDGSNIKKSINKSILIVEDNNELRCFLKQTFEEKYLIYEAADGIAGLEMAEENIPDLIISDVMMPRMNGIEFCRSVKEKFETRHIPIIILSAKEALESKIEGMESGADYYFAKPLSMNLLALTIQNIFERAEKVKEYYSNNYYAQATVLVSSQKDKFFINQLLSIIEENIKDPELDVDFLCDHLFISRTKLYQKIKSISDQSVGEFIRTVRLKTAIKIMTHEDVALYEVAERIGLQSSATFSRTFKKEYGKSPLQYMQSLRKTS